MARVTTKLQVTIPKAIADRYGIEPGTEIEWLPAGEAIRVVPPAPGRSTTDRARRVDLFDRATQRQRLRQTGRIRAPAGATRGWSRDELYGRAGPD